MLVYDFIRIPLPVAQVRNRLLAAVSRLLQQVAEAAYDEGEELLSRVGPFGPVPGLSKAVKVYGGKVRDRGEGFVMPLRWSATGPAELFPVMEADLEVSPLGSGESQLRLSGSYDPPLGSIGRQLDRLLLHQLAEATVRAFLSQLVSALLNLSEAEVADSSDRISRHAPATANSAADIDESAFGLEEHGAQGSRRPSSFS